MRIIFIGCVESSYILLKKLLESGKNIVGVITKNKSGFNSDYVDIVPLCVSYHIPYIYVENINDDNSIEFIKKTNPDIGYCFGWSQLIKNEIINIFPKGIVGFHPAALPNNRGRHPIIWALSLGLTETASTFFMIDKNADMGDILSQKYINIEYEDDARSLYNKIMNEASEQIIPLTTDLERGNESRIKQLPENGNIWRKRNKFDGCIDWRMSSRAIYNLVRSLTKPYIGAHFVFNGNEYKVWKVQEIITDDYRNIEPGRVININADGSIEVKSYDNLVKLIEYDKIESIEKGTCL